MHRQLIQLFSKCSCCWGTRLQPMVCLSLLVHVALGIVLLGLSMTINAAASALSARGGSPA